MSSSSPVFDGEHPNLAAPGPCLFLRLLPPEIRNKIYKYLLTFPLCISPPVSTCIKKSESLSLNKITLTKSRLPTQDERWNWICLPEKILAITRTCRQIHYESLSVYYSENTFSFGSIYETYQYLHLIEEERMKPIGGLQIFWRGQESDIQSRRSDAKLLFGFLETFPLVNLKTLRIGAWEDMGHRPRPLVDLVDVMEDLIYLVRGRKLLEVKIRETHPGPENHQGIWHWETLGSKYTGSNIFERAIKVWHWGAGPRFQEGLLAGLEERLNAETLKDKESFDIWDKIKEERTEREEAVIEKTRRDDEIEAQRIKSDRLEAARRRREERKNAGNRRPPRRSARTRKVASVKS